MKEPSCGATVMALLPLCPSAISPMNGGTFRRAARRYQFPLHLWEGLGRGENAYFPPCNSHFAYYSPHNQQMLRVTRRQPHPAMVIRRGDPDSRERRNFPSRSILVLVCYSDSSSASCSAIRSSEQNRLSMNSASIS